MNEQLTTLQNKTIEALLLTNTIDRAAKRANVSEASIYRWMKQESFQTALRAARRDILAHTTTRFRKVGTVGTGDDNFQDKLRRLREQSLSHAALQLQEGVSKAVGILYDLIGRDKRIEAGRSSLIRTALEFGFRSSVYSDVIERMKTLEKNQAAGSNQ